MKLQQYYLDVLRDPQRRGTRYWTPSVERFLAQNCRDILPDGTVLTYWDFEAEPPDFRFVFQKIRFQEYDPMGPYKLGDDLYAKEAEYISLKTAWNEPLVFCLSDLLTYFDGIPKYLYFWWDKFSLQREQRFKTNMSLIRGRTQPEKIL